MLQPMLGFCSALTGWSDSTASTAARRSRPLTGRRCRDGCRPMTAVDEAALRVEQKEIRRADGAISLGRLLRLVVAERKSEAGLAGHLPQPRGRIVGIGGCVIGEMATIARACRRNPYPSARAPPERAARMGNGGR